MNETLWQWSAAEFAPRLCGKCSGSGAEDPAHAIDQYVNSQGDSEYPVKPVCDPALTVWLVVWSFESFPTGRR